jgi:hypothetical protein
MGTNTDVSHGREGIVVSRNAMVKATMGTNTNALWKIGHGK